MIRVYELVGCQNTNAFNAFRYSICHFYVRFVTILRIQTHVHLRPPSAEIRPGSKVRAFPFATLSSVHRVLREDSLNFDAKPEHTYLGITKDWVTVMLLLQHPLIIVYACSFQESTTYMRLWVCKKESFSGCFFFQLQSAYKKMYGVSPLFVTYFFCWTCRSPPELIPLATTARHGSSPPGVWTHDRQLLTIQQVGQTVSSLEIHAAGPQRVWWPKLAKQLGDQKQR